jgi:hypothetical protein
MATTTTTQWQDLLVRNSTSDTGQIPAAGQLSDSPDLIPAGTSPAADPTSFLADMSVDYGQNVDAGEDNYLYARGVNLYPGAESGTLHLYYAEASLLQWPAQWSPNEIPLNDGTLGNPVSANANGDDFVTAAPYFWQDVPTPPPNNHYCLIGRMVTESNPNPIPTILEIPDFATYIANNRGMSWRNINVVQDPDAPTWSTNVAYAQGATTEQLYVQLVCENIPVGCAVAFSCGTPGPVPVINLEQTTITTTPTQVLGITTTIPAGFSSSITYSFWSNGKTLPANAKITLMAVYVPPAGSDLALQGVDLAEFGIAPEDMHPEHRERLAIGPVTGVSLGSFSSVVSA